jgi:gas vesicle protein
MSFGLNESEEFMKSILIGIVAGVLIASTVGAFQADEHKSVSPIGGMMQGMQGMMGHHKQGDQSQDTMQDMKEMMARMSRMMDMCSEMLSHASESTKDETSK